MDMSWSCLLDRLYTTLHGFTGSLVVAAHMSKVKMDSEVEPTVQPRYIQVCEDGLISVLSICSCKE